MPEQGPLSIGVPGMVRGYRDLLANHGSRTFEELVQPALGSYAANGHPIAFDLSDHLAADVELLELFRTRPVRPFSCLEASRPREATGQASGPGGDLPAADRRRAGRFLPGRGLAERIAAGVRRSEVCSRPRSVNARDGDHRAALDRVSWLPDQPDQPSLAEADSP